MSWLTSSVVGRVALVATQALSGRWNLARRVDALTERVEALAETVHALARLVDRLADDASARDTQPIRVDGPAQSADDSKSRGTP